MQRVTWKGHILPGKIEEYKERHANIWPEMTAMLNDAGIHNYTIWLTGNEIFGYYECEDADYAAKVQADSEVSVRWEESMKGIMEITSDGRGENGLTQVFYHE